MGCRCFRHQVVERAVAKVVRLCSVKRQQALRYRQCGQDHVKRETFAAVATSVAEHCLDTLTDLGVRVFAFRVVHLVFPIHVIVAMASSPHNRLMASSRGISLAAYFSATANA
jgi:hypothetical protein